jgi:hypothetical protein
VAVPIAAAVTCVAIAGKRGAGEQHRAADDDSKDQTLDGDAPAHGFLTFLVLVALACDGEEDRG